MSKRKTVAAFDLGPAPSETEQRSFDAGNEQRLVSAETKPRKLPSLFSKRGRGPGDLTQDELDKALEILSEPRGTLTRAAESCGVSDMTMYRALTERCSDSYARARKQRASAHAHRIETLVEDLQSGAVAPDAGRVILDGLKWLAERMDRGLWGPQPEAQPGVDPTLGALAVVGAAALREQLAAMVGAIGLGVATVLPVEKPAIEHKP